MRYKVSRVLCAMVSALAFCVAVACGFELLTTDSAAVKAVLGGLKGTAVIRDDSNGKVLVVLSLPKLTYFALPAEVGSCYNPRISPDGRWVMYELAPASAGEMNRIVLRSIEQGNSARVLAGTGYEPEFWKDPRTGELYVVYGTKNEQIVTTKYGGETMRQKLVDQKLTGAAELLLDQSYKAGLSKDGRWLGTANKSVFLYNTENNRYRGLYAVTSGSTCFERLSPSVDPSRMDQICFINTSHDTLLTYNSQVQEVWALSDTVIAKALSTSHDSVSWQSNGWSNFEDVMLTGYRDERTPAKQQCMALVRRGDTALVLLCKGGPHQDLWIEGAPEYTPELRSSTNWVLPAGRLIDSDRTLVLQGALAAKMRLPVASYDLRGARILGSNLRGAPVPTIVRGKE